MRRKDDNQDALRLRVKGWLRIIHRDVDGSLIRDEQFHNLITYAGLGGLAAVSGGIEDPFDWIALGTGNTPAAYTDTELEIEIEDSGLERAQDASPSRTTTTQTNDTLVIDYEWTASGNKSITEAGLLNASADGTLLARRVFSAYVLSPGQTVTVSWQIQFS